MQKKIQIPRLPAQDGPDGETSLPSKPCNPSQGPQAAAWARAGKDCVPPPPFFLCAPSLPRPEQHPSTLISVIIKKSRHQKRKLTFLDMKIQAHLAYNLQLTSTKTTRFLIRKLFPILYVI